MFPAYKRQKSYLLAGILIDDISNYALLYNVHAIKKNGELHRGMDGFCQEKNMVQVPLTVLSEWERIELWIMRSLSWKTRLFLPDLWRKVVHVHEWAAKTGRAFGVRTACKVRN